MQIVIDIPDEQYKRICYHTDGVRVYDMISLLAIIENGTPLPKGHGRLIDENVIKRMIEDAKVKNDFSKTFAENIIKFVPTIIESDKGE